MVDDECKSMGHEQCVNISETLESLVNEDLYLYDGEFYTSDALKESGVDIDSDKVEPATIYDYLTDDSIYNLEFRMHNKSDLNSVSVMVACGGPNIYIDTGSGYVELYWWSITDKVSISDRACDMVNEWAEELWGCMA